MEISFQALLTILALISYAYTANPDKLSLANKDIADHPSRIRFTDFENTLANGAMLRARTLNCDIETTVMLLDSEAGEAIKQADNLSSSAALIHGFLEASEHDFEQTVESIVKTAVTLRAINLLRTLSMFYVWSSPEQFHWFQAISYKSEWYSPTVWKDNPTPMDWNKNLYTIFMADNPILLNDLESGIISRSASIIDNNASLDSAVDDNAPLYSTINDNALLDLTIKHDSINIYQSLQPTFTATHLKSLVESGSFKILRFLAESKSINVHLEEYPLPHTLPEDFEFFWMQGYRYLPASHFLSLACKHGRTDIINFLYNLNPNVLNPSNGYYLSSAAKNGHLNILEWAFNHKLPIKNAVIGSALILNSQFKVFEQLQEKLVLPTSKIQNISNKAAQKDNLNVLKWLYDKYKIVPGSFYLGRTSIKTLEWIESVDSQKITSKLAENANLENLKWLSINYPHLLTNTVKDEHGYRLADLEKLQWMLFQGWEVVPDLTKAASLGELEVLKFGYDKLQVDLTKSHAESAAENGHVMILEWIYSIDPFYIDQSNLLIAVENNHVKAAKYLESILNLKDTALELDLGNAFYHGNLELVEWAYQNYKLDQPEKWWLKDAILKGHLNIINYAIEHRFILETSEKYLKTAILSGQYQIFQRLLDYGMSITKIKDYVLLAFNSNKLEILNYFVTKDPESAQILKNQKITPSNHHMVQWLRDHNLWPE